MWCPSLLQVSGSPYGKRVPLFSSLVTWPGLRCPPSKPTLWPGRWNPLFGQTGAFVLFWSRIVGSQGLRVGGRMGSPGKDRVLSPEEGGDVLGSGTYSHVGCSWGHVGHRGAEDCSPPVRSQGATQSPHIRLYVCSPFTKVTSLEVESRRKQPSFSLPWTLLFPLWAYKVVGISVPIPVFL